jgi:hypothetical protein
LDGRRALLILNDARTAAQVPRLLPDTPGSRVLITSQRRLADLVRSCGYLPLAIRIAAGRLRARPAWTVEHFARQLRGEQHSLAELAVGDRSVANAFAASYHQLPADRQRVFRLLGLLPAITFDAEFAAVAADIDPVTARQALEDLVDVHLLQQTSPGWYRMHLLVRCHARQLAEQAELDPQRTAAVRRIRAHRPEAIALAR